MNRPTRKRKIVYTILALMIIAGAGYFIIFPEMIASQYISGVHQAGSLLREGYVKLEDSTGQTLIDDPAVTSSDLVSQIETLLNLLHENRIMLDRFATKTQDYHPLPYTGMTPRATAARALQVRSVAFTEQSNDAFTKYEQLVNFIKRYDETASIVEQHVNGFNATTDLNIYAGRAGDFYEIARQIRTNVHALDEDTTPHEAEQFKTASVQAFNQVADGFDQLAFGLQLPADTIIYSSAERIESVDQTISDQNQSIYSRDILSSRTIKSIQELREKLELILP